MNFFNRYSDNLLIGYFLGEVALGYYSVAYRVLQVLIQLLVSTGNQVAFPILSRLQAEPDRFIRGFYRMVKLASSVTLPIFFGVIALSSELIIVIFGAQWEPSIPIMRLFSLGGLAYLILFFNRSVFVAMGKPFWQLRLEIANVALNVVACVVAVRWGILAVALAYIASDFMMVPVSLWVLRKLVGIPFVTYCRQLAAPLSGAAVMMVLTWLVGSGLGQVVRPAVVLVVSTLAGALFYVLFLRVFAPSLLQELWTLAAMGRAKGQRQGS